MGITVCDVGPRDGLQNEAVTLAPALRAELCNRLAAAGVPRVEAVSFVRDDRVPQMAGAEEVVAALERQPGVVYAGLVLNERGYDRLLASGLDEARRDVRSDRELQPTERERVRRRGRGCGRRDRPARGRRRDPATATISVSFGCPFEGPVPADRVLTLAGEIVAVGAAEVVFADTIGVAVPSQVSSMVASALSLDVPVGVHLHNTRNTAIACAVAALEAGATVFDASVGGAGGCPFAPNATGNVATEDLLYTLHGEGVETGIDLDALIEVARWLGSSARPRARRPRPPRGAFPLGSLDHVEQTPDLSSRRGRPLGQAPDCIDGPGLPWDVASSGRGRSAVARLELFAEARPGDVLAERPARPSARRRRRRPCRARAPSPESL